MQDKTRLYKLRALQPWIWREITWVHAALEVYAWLRASVSIFILIFVLCVLVSSIRCILSHGLSVSFCSILKVPSFCVLSVFVLPDFVPLPPFFFTLSSFTKSLLPVFLPASLQTLSLCLHIVFKSEAEYPPPKKKNPFTSCDQEMVSTLLISMSSLLCTCCGEERDAEEVNADKSGFTTSCRVAHSSVNFTAFSTKCIWIISISSTT